MMEKIKILVVDDHPMVLEGMQAMLKQLNFVMLTGLAGNSYQAMELIKNNQPDIIITDISMPEISGIEFTAKVKKEYPQIKVIAMSTFNERSYISQMIQNGASGYMLKNSSSEEIEQAILAVSAGELYMSADLTLNKQEARKQGKPPVLSIREKEILLLIADGYTNIQIAEKLFISPHTVDSHRKSLLTKFEVNNTAGLIKAAIRCGMV
jgi:DNA-binding NarL/FixJ family response regulator